jgi:predicted PurR-regulated permease PerM
MAAIALGPIYAVTGVQYPVALAVIVALAWLIPMLGALLIVALVIAVAMLSGPAVAATAALCTVLVLATLEFIVQPRLVGPRRFSSLLIVLMMMAMSSVAGLVGLLLAPPVAAAIQIILGQMLPSPSEQPGAAPTQSLASSTGRLQERLAQAHAILASMPEPAAPEARSLLDRLNLLVDKATGSETASGSGAGQP